MTLQLLITPDQQVFRYLHIGNQPWFLGLDVMDAANIHSTKRKKIFDQLGAIPEPNPLKGRPRKLLNREGVLQLLPGLDLTHA